jgi:hypothetical protein
MSATNSKRTVQIVAPCAMDAGTFVRKYECSLVPSLFPYTPFTTHSVFFLGYTFMAAHDGVTFPVTVVRQINYR